MANRDGYPSHDLSPGRVTIEWWFDTTAGATAAPTSTAATGHGIASISKSKAGTYVILFQDTWVSCAQASASMANPLDTFSYATITQPDVTSAKSVTVQTVAANGAGVVDPVGTRVYVALVMDNTTARK